MPYIESTDDLQARLARRLLISGPPNNGKTTSLLTCHRPLAIVSAPGELGITSIPKEEGVQVFHHQLDYNSPISWGQTVSETRTLITELITGKHGPKRTIAIDGLHKIYGMYLLQASGGKPPSDFDARKLYPKATEEFFTDLRKWLTSPVEYLVCTVWVGRDKEDPDAKGDVVSHIFPALPGQSGQNIVGEFAACVYADKEGQGKTAKYVWRTVPDQKVWGVGIKLPIAQVAKIPALIPQDYKVLEGYLK